MTKLTNRLSTFEWALRRLGEAIQQAVSDLEVDGAIRRFEFTFELFWKLLKAHLEHEGVLCRSPKDCLKEDFKLELIHDEDRASDARGSERVGPSLL